MKLALSLSLSLLLFLSAPQKKPQQKPQPHRLEKPIQTYLENHDPLHIDQLHRLLELTEKKPPTVEETAEALQAMVKSGRVVISTTPNNEKWRPITVILWDDEEHKTTDPEGVR